MPYEQFSQTIQEILDAIPLAVVLLNNDKKIHMANRLGTDFVEKFAVVEPDGTLKQFGSHMIDDLFVQASSGGKQEIYVTNPVSHIFEIAIQPINSLLLGLTDNSKIIVIQDISSNHILSYPDDASTTNFETLEPWVGNVAEEFQQILGSVLFNIESILSMDPNLTPLSDARLKASIQHLEKALLTIKQIMDSIKYTPLRLEQTDIRQWLEDGHHMLNGILPDTITVTIDVEPESLVTALDPQRFKLVLLNLGLLLKHIMLDVGALEIQLRVTSVSPEPSASIVAASSDKWINITVKGNGKGLPPELISHIFDPYIMDQIFEGGVGLMMIQAQGIIAQHNGFLRADSVLETGTTFNVYVPMDLDKVRDRVSTGVILLIEPDTYFRHFVVQVLSELHYNVLLSPTYEQAKVIYTSQPIDLIISDFDVLQQHIHDFSTADDGAFSIPIIASVPSVLTEESEGVAVTAYLPKNCGVEELLDAVQNAIGNKLD